MSIAVAYNPGRMNDYQNKKAEVGCGWGWLLRRMLARGEDPSGTEAKNRLGAIEGWVSTLISVLLSGIKLLLGWISGSISLLADGLNNLADVWSSIVVIVGFKWAQKPRDDEHPFGHGRMETVAVLILSIILVIVGFEVGKEGVQRLIHPQLCYAPWWLVVMICATIALKYALASFASMLARITGSQVLEADSWNHRFDILSTSLVLLALLGSHFGWKSIDGWGGVGVSLFILFTGVKYARSAINTLIGEAPTRDEINLIENTSLRVPGVKGVHDIMVHKYGDAKLVSFHIEVDASQTAMDVHNLSERVELEVEKVVSCKATVHGDPVDRTHPKYAEAARLMELLVKEDSRLAGFHDLRIEGGQDGFNLSVDMVVRSHVMAAMYEEVIRDIRDVIQKKLESVRQIGVRVEVESSAEPHFSRQDGVGGVE